MNIQKILTILILLTIMLSPTLSAVNATSVFLTSDNLFGQKGEEDSRSRSRCTGTW